MPDITKDRTDLIERAATELGALTSNDTLSQEDSDTINALVDPLLRELEADEVVTIQDVDAIPSELFLPLARLLANEAAPSFGQQTNADLRMENERKLRKLSAGKPTYQVQRAKYF